MVNDPEPTAGAASQMVLQSATVASAAELAAGS